MSALASVGIFTGDEDGRFTRTPLSECLRRDVPGSQRAMAVMMGEGHYQRLGRPPGERPHMARPPSNGSTASPIFDYLGECPEQAQIFDAAITSIHGWDITYASWLFIVALGLTLVFGVLKILNIAHGARFDHG